MQNEAIWDCNECYIHVHVVAQCYLSNPQVTSMHLDSNFTGTEKCALYRRYSESEPFQLQNDTKRYFQRRNGVFCFTEGTDSYNNTGCVCLPGCYGQYCSIPASVWYSNLPHRTRDLLKTRHDSQARRLVYAMPFNIEFAMFEARLAEFGDVVDMFLVLESNYTGYGRPKPLRLLEMLCLGKYSQYAHKIVHVWLDYFPKEANKDGWMSDRHRDYMGQYGLRYLVRGYRHDDLIVLTDADELPYRDTILFLKLHDGYPEPVIHSYRNTIYGFYWNLKDYTTLPTTVSIGILTHVLELKVISVRKGVRDIRNNVARLNTYIKSHSSVTIKEWMFGNFTHPAGWHCSWCFDPEGIQNKLTSAINADFPRWGDYPSKVKLSYIRKLVAIGIWFDDTSRFKQRTSADIRYAPEFILQHRDAYRNLLENQWIHIPAQNVTIRKATSGPTSVYYLGNET